MKPLKLLSILLSALVICFSVFLAFLFNTQAGLNFAVRITTRFLPDLRIEKAKGTLASAVHLDHVVYQDAERKIYIENMAIMWTPSALLRWELQIDRFETSSIQVLRKTHKKITINANKNNKDNELIQVLSIPTLPIGVVFKHLNIASVKVGSHEKTSLIIDQIKGKMTLTNTVREGNFKAQMKAPFSLKTDFKMWGQPDHYKITLNLKNAQFNWEMQGQGNQKQFAFTTSRPSFFGGHLIAQGLVKQSDWHFLITAKNVDLKQFSPVLLNASLTGKGNGDEGVIKLSLNNTRYWQHSFFGQARLDFNYPQIQAFTAEFHSDKSTLQIEGQLKDQWLFNWHAKIPNLTILHPDLGGSLISQGEISGERKNPKLQVNLQAKHFKKGNLSIANIDSKLNFSFGNAENPRLYLNADNIKIGIYEISRIHLLGKIKSTPQETRVVLKLKPGVLKYPVETVTRRSQFSGGKWNWVFTEKNIHSTFDFQLMSNSHLEGDITLPSQLSLDSNEAIKGNIKGSINHLDFISGLTSPTVRNIKGNITANFDFSGTLAKPQTRTNILFNASAFMPEYNLNLKNIKLTIQGQNQNLTYNGQVQSGNTTLNLSGNTKLSFLDGVQSTFLIQSPRFLVTNTPEIKIYAAPKLTIQSNNTKTEIKGNIHIVEAKIAPLDFSSISTLPDDVRFVHATPSLADKFSVESDILITMSDHVYINYEGLSGNLAGQVRIHSRPVQLTLGDGRIEVINGTYLLRGRKFILQRGYLNFNGPAANPGFDVRAVRNVSINNLSLLDSPLGLGINNIIVGVKITGTLRRHRIALFSEPSGLSQANILAYLLTGQSANAVTGDNLQLVMEVAGALGENSTTNVTDQVRQGLGLSQLTFQEDQASVKRGTTGQHTSLILGKAITPRLFINYNVGLIQSLNTFKIRYLLWKNWILQGSSNADGTGVDMIYSIERGDNQ